MKNNSTTSVPGRFVKKTTLRAAGRWGVNLLTSPSAFPAPLTASPVAPAAFPAAPLATTGRSPHRLAARSLVDAERRDHRRRQ